MKLTVNLASRPFFEIRPLLFRLRIGMAALAALAILLGIVLHLTGQHARKDSATMQDLVQKTQQLQNERTSNENAMHQPANAAVLEQSQYLNQLFAAKSFSWTAVMMELEDVLPGGVMVTSIDPAIDKNGVVSIRLRVSGDRDKAIDLVRNLETSKHFRHPRLADEATQSQQQTVSGNRYNPQPVSGANGVEFDIFSEYVPLPLHDAHAETAEDNAAAGKSAEPRTAEIRNTKSGHTRTRKTKTAPKGGK